MNTKTILAIIPAILILFSSFLPIKKVESYDLLPGDNPNYKIIENDGQKYFYYNYVQVGQIHERRFVAENEVFYFIRKFHPMSSSLEMVNEHNQTLMHGYTTDQESTLYFGRNDRYEKKENGLGVSIYKNDQLILRSNLIYDKNYGSRINIEYSESDPNLKSLRLMALETTIRNFENSPPVQFHGETEENFQKKRTSRY